MAYTINQRVAIYRKMANLTQTEAAERLGMKCSTYSQMERKGNISVDKLMAIAEVFGVNPAPRSDGSASRDRTGGSRVQSADRNARACLYTHSASCVCDYQERRKSADRSSQSSESRCRRDTQLYQREISEFKEKEINSGSECEPIINN